jgi:hypothetical protein
VATQCFKIEWSGFYSLNEVKSQPEAKKLGLYVVYRTTPSGKRNLWYIGKATEIETRINQHKQQWQQGFTPRELNRLQVLIGVLTSLDGKPATQGQLRDIESLFINEYHPQGNAPSTMKGYRGRSVIIANIGKMGRFAVTHDKNLLKLLKAVL